MKKKKSVLYADSYVLDILLEKINSDKLFFEIGSSYHWQDLVFYSDTGIIVYEGSIYSFERKLTDILLKRIVEKNNMSDP